MSQSRKRDGGRLLAEFAVIILGVLVALAADRWVVGIEEAELRDEYLTSLRDDLRADSATFAEAGASTAENIGNVGLLLSVLRVGPTASADRGAVLVAVEVLSWWLPVQYATGTWADLLATGNLRLIDRDLRRELSAYYEGIDNTALFEAEKRQGPFRRYESVVSRLLTPEQRVRATLDLFGADTDTTRSLWESWGLPDPGMDISSAATQSDGQFDSLIDRIRDTPNYEALLGDILIGSWGLTVYYQGLLEEVTEFLAKPGLAGAAP